MKQQCKRWIECTLKCSILPLISNFSLQFAHVWNPTLTRFELLEIISVILCSLSLWNLNSWQGPDLITADPKFPFRCGFEHRFDKHLRGYWQFFHFWQIVLCIDRRQFCQKALLSTLAATIKVPCYNQVHVRSTTQLACRTWIRKALDTWRVTFWGWMLKQNWLNTKMSRKPQEYS